MTLADGLVIGGQPGQVGGFAQVGVPNVIGKARADAEADLASLGLNSRVVDVETLGTAGTVYDQTPRVPATLSKGSVVTLQVIKAPPTPTPDIVEKLDELKSLTTKIDTDLTALAAIANALEKDADAKTRQEDIKGLTTQLGTDLTALAAVAASLEKDADAKTRQEDIKALTTQLGTDLTALAAAAAALETDTAAETRQDEIIAKLEDIATQLSEEKSASSSTRKSGSKTA